MIYFLDIMKKEDLPKKIPIFPIPGPSAITTAMSVSGFEDKFLFYGFLPKKDKELERSKKITENQRQF